jgi:hypothetical protein
MRLSNEVTSRDRNDAISHNIGSANAAGADPPKQAYGTGGGIPPKGLLCLRRRLRFPEGAISNGGSSSSFRLPQKVGCRRTKAERKLIGPRDPSPLRVQASEPEQITFEGEAVTSAALRRVPPPAMATQCNCQFPRGNSHKASTFLSNRQIA